MPKLLDRRGIRSLASVHGTSIIPGVGGVDARFFDGTDDHIAIYQSPIEDFPTSGSQINDGLNNSLEGISAHTWFYLSPNFSSKGVIWEVSGTTGGLGGNIEIGVDANRYPYAYINNTNVYTTLTSSTQIDVEEWHSIGVTTDEADHYLYVDGVEEDSASFNCQYYDKTHTACIGAFLQDLGGNPTNFFAGGIGDVIIYGRALSGVDMFALYSVFAGSIPLLNPPFDTHSIPISTRTFVAYAPDVQLFGTDTLSLSERTFTHGEGIGFNTETLSFALESFYSNDEINFRSEDLSISSRSFVPAEAVLFTEQQFTTSERQFTDIFDEVVPFISTDLSITSYHFVTPVVFQFDSIPMTAGVFGSAEAILFGEGSTSFSVNSFLLNESPLFNEADISINEYSFASIEGADDSQLFATYTFTLTENSFQDYAGVVAPTDYSGYWTFENRAEVISFSTAQYLLSEKTHRVTPVDYSGYWTFDNIL